MALISCRECGKPVSTEAAACPHCGAPSQRPVPPLLPDITGSVRQKENIIYSDSAVAVTSTRVVIGGTTYALRNITSVKMAFSSPDIIGPVCLILFGGVHFISHAHSVVPSKLSAGFRSDFWRWNHGFGHSSDVQPQTQIPRRYFERGGRNPCTDIKGQGIHTTHRAERQ